MSIQKTKIRLLPIFIFVACLLLSIKISHVAGSFKYFEGTSLNIGTAAAQAEEQAAAKETEELTDVLNNGSEADQAPVQNAFTSSEIMILQELAERREALDAKAKDIDKRAIQLRVAETEIDKKVKQLKEYEQRLSKLINQYTLKEQENVSALVKLYASMKPKDAARIFNTMDIDITVAILRRMKPSSSSAILSQMNSEKAQAVTAELIGNNI